MFGCVRTNVCMLAHRVPRMNETEKDKVNTRKKGRERNRQKDSDRGRNSQRNKQAKSQTNQRIQKENTRKWRQVRNARSSPAMIRNPARRHGRPSKIDIFCGVKILPGVKFP